MFLKSGGYWEDLEPIGYEDLGAGKWGVGWGRQLGQRRRIGVSAEVGVGSFDFGCACGHRNLVGGLGWRLVPEDIAFVRTLARLGQCKKIIGKTVGGALSNCKTGGLSRNDTYEAACPPSIVRARRARDTSGRTAQTRAQPGTGKQTQSQTKDRTAGQQAQNQTQTWTQDCVTRQTTTAGSYSNCSRGPESVRLVSSWSVRLRAAF